MRAWRAGLVLLALIGCPDRPRDPRPEAPNIVAFSTSADRVERGRSIVLAWEVKGADSVVIESLGPVDAKGEQTVTVERDLTLILIARSTHGETRAVLLVAAYDTTPLRLVDFQVTPPRFRAGDALTIRWDAPGATGVTVRDVGRRVLADNAPARHELIFTPAGDTLVSLVANGPGGPITATLSASLVVEAPVILSFGITTPVLERGDTWGVFWNVAGANTCQLSILGGLGSLIVEVRPNANFTADPQVGRYTIELFCTGEGGQVRESQALVVVEPSPPELEILSVSPEPSGAGGTIEIAYRVARAQSLSFERPFGTEAGLPALGRHSLVAPERDETLIVVATRGMIRVSRAVSLRIDARLPAIRAIDANALGGRDVQVGWQIENADRVTLAGELDPGPLADVEASAGAATLPVAGLWVILTAHNAQGITARRVRVGGR